MTTIRYPAGHSSADWGCIISSAVSAGAPSGDEIYLFANRVKINGKSLDKANYISDNRARRLARGRRRCDVQIPSAWIPTRKMSELNTCNFYIRAWKAKGHAPIYLWIRTKESSSWVYYDFEAEDGSAVDYLMGYIDVNDDDLSEIFLKTIKFSNAYSGGT